MGAKKFSHTHRSTMCGMKKLAKLQGFSCKWKVEKCWQNGGARDGSGGGNRPKTIIPPVTRGDLMIVVELDLDLPSRPSHRWSQ